MISEGGSGREMKRRRREETRKRDVDGSTDGALERVVR